MSFDARPACSTRIPRPVLADEAAPGATLRAAERHRAIEPCRRHHTHGPRDGRETLKMMAPPSRAPARRDTHGVRTTGRRTLLASARPGSRRHGARGPTVVLEAVNSEGAGRTGSRKKNHSASLHPERTASARWRGHQRRLAILHEGGRARSSWAAERRWPISYLERTARPSGTARASTREPTSRVMPDGDEQGEGLGGGLEGIRFQAVGPAIARDRRKAAAGRLERPSAPAARVRTAFPLGE